MSWASQQPNGGFPGQPPPQVQVRTYAGKDAQRQYQIDAAQMSQANWFPVAQTWVEGPRRTLLLVLGILGLLFILLPGILFLIAWLVYRRPGSLTVTYQYRPPQG